MGTNNLLIKYIKGVRLSPLRNDVLTSLYTKIIFVLFRYKYTLYKTNNAAITPMFSHGNILHLFSFNTPILGVKLSEKSSHLCASLMRKGVVLRNKKIHTIFTTNIIAIHCKIRSVETPLHHNTATSIVLYVTIM
jgi:hypothetical protein